MVGDIANTTCWHCCYVYGRGRRLQVKQRPLIARNAWLRRLRPQPILRDCEDDRIPSAIGNAIRGLA